MPAKVIEPNGNRAHPDNCGILARYDAKDSNGALKRIPFINVNNKFKNGDLVIIEVVENLTLTDSNGNVGNIAVAKIDAIHEKSEWNEKDKTKWENAWNVKGEKNKYNTSDRWKEHPLYK